MIRLRGQGVGAGMTLGTAAVVRVRGGIPLQPEPPARMTLRRGAEAPEVIVVAEDYRTALAVSGALSWGKVVGVAAASAEPEARVPPFPAVVGLSNLMGLVEDDVLMLVDAGRGIVLVDPDGLAIAQYQAEHDRLAPKHRLYIDDAHLPAGTLDGHTLQVVACAGTMDDVSRALVEGADALYIPFDAPLLPSQVSESSLRHSLFRLIDTAAGKSLMISDDYALSLPVLMEAGARADIVLAVPPREDLEGLGLGELSQELRSVEEECLENDTAYGLPRLAAEMAPGAAGNVEARVDALAAQGISQLVCVPSGALDAECVSFLESVVAAARRHLLGVAVPAYRAGISFDAPDEVHSQEEQNRLLRLLVGMGAASLLVEPNAVAATKEALRAMTYTECREALFEFLSNKGTR